MQIQQFRQTYFGINFAWLQRQIKLFYFSNCSKEITLKYLINRFRRAKLVLYYLQIASSMLLPFVSPKIILLTQLWPITIQITQLRFAKQALTEAKWMVAVWIMKCIFLATQVRQVCAGRPETMDCKRFAIPHISPVDSALILSAELFWPGEGQNIMIIENLFAFQMKGIYTLSQRESDGCYDKEGR